MLQNFQLFAIEFKNSKYFQPVCLSTSGIIIQLNCLYYLYGSEISFQIIFCIPKITQRFEVCVLYLA